MAKGKVGEWLEKKYLQWQLSEGERKSLDQFALYLGLSRPFVSMVINGKRTPSPEVAQKWAVLLDDDEIFDLLGIPLPDPIYYKLEKKTKDLSPKEKEKLWEFLGKLLDIDQWEIQQYNVVFTLIRDRIKDLPKKQAENYFRTLNEILRNASWENHQHIIMTKRLKETTNDLSPEKLDELVQLFEEGKNSKGCEE